MTDDPTATDARSAPVWEPGTRSECHGGTFGYLVGELVRRIDGRSLDTFSREEIAEPLGADFMIAFGAEHGHRCAEVIGDDGPTDVNSREWRAAGDGAATGHGTADSLARVYAALARQGELDGVQVLRAETIDAAAQEQLFPGIVPWREAHPFRLGAYVAAGTVLAIVVVARIDRLRRQAEGLADAGDPGPAFFDFFATVVEGSHTKLALVDALDRPDLPAVLAASPAGQGLVEALDRLLRRAQAAGAVRGDVLVTDVMALFIACSRAVQQVPGDDRASRRILAVVRDGLRPPPSGPDQLRVPR